MKGLSGKTCIVSLSLVISCFLIFKLFTAYFSLVSFASNSVCSSCEILSENFCDIDGVESCCNAAACSVKASFVENNRSENNNIIKLNFDKIYPDTQLSKIFDSCLKVYQDLDVLHSRYVFKFDQVASAQESANFDIFTDLLVGKLFNIKVGISKVPAYHDEDVAYLNTIFDKILLEYQTTCVSYPQFNDNPKSENIKEIILEIKNKLRD